MTDSSDNTMDNVIGYKAKTAERVCQVAYTLNNDQPVLCSIIGNQPFFYMDTEEDFLDDEFLNEEEIEILEQEVSALRKEIAIMEKNSDLWATDEEEKHLAFHENALSFSDQEPEEENFDAAQIISILEKSRMAKAYLDAMNEHNVKLCLTGEIETSCYDRGTGKILINQNISQAKQVLLAARELRRHWQHRQGALVHPLMLTPDHGVLINRVQVCDLVTSMIRIAWELQLGGEKMAWEEIESGSMADLGRAFAREAFLDFRTINNGVAAASVFETWFLSERCLNEDKTLIQQMLSDYQGYVFDNDAPLNYLTAELISALGAMPYGKNYLAAHVTTIMNDPVFTEVRDRSNANFLWFIKFERSFRETEQKLQTSSAPTESEFLRDPNSQNYEGSDYATAQDHQGAEIIRLYDTDTSGTKANDGNKKLEAKGRTKSRPVSAKKRKGSQSISAGENIVAFRMSHSE